MTPHRRKITSNGSYKIAVFVSAVVTPGLGYSLRLCSRVTRAIALDCEFVGVGFEGKDDALARVSVVNQFGHVILDAYVRPKEKITNYRTAVSGITPHHMRKGGPAKSFDAVQAQVSDLCKGRILVGHAIHNDLRVGHPQICPSWHRLPIFDGRFSI